MVYIGFEGKSGVKEGEQGSEDTIIIPIFSNINIMALHAVLLSAKYRNNYCISTPLFPSFLHHRTIAFKSYIPLTFSERMFFISCKQWFRTKTKCLGPKHSLCSVYR